MKKMERKLRSFDLREQERSERKLCSFDLKKSGGYRESEEVVKVLKPYFPPRKG